MKEDKRKIRMFELYKDLYIGQNNYEQFASKFDRAVAKGKAKFMFKNYKGKPYIVETEYVKFVLNLFETMPHGELMDKANQYKKDEIKLTKEEFEKKQHERKMKELELQGKMKAEHIEIAQNDVESDMTRIRKQ